MVVLLLCLCWVAPLLAQAPGGAVSYRVTIVLYPGDDTAAVAKRLAAMYRGTLETPVDGNGSFTISLSEAGAGLMRRDPMVAEMDGPSFTPSVAPTAASGNAAAPAPPGTAVQTNATTSWTLGPYPYDGSGNIRAVGSDFYAYDQLGRLVVSADAPPSTPVVQKQTYTYDPYGNLRSINTAGRPAATFEMVGASNRLASVSNGSVSAPAGYDASGNFVSYLGATYEYDALDVMRKSVTGGVTRSYVYTASDERIGTIEQTGSGIRSEWTIRNSAGQVLRRYSKESNGEWKWQEDYIYRGTQMLAAEIPDSSRTRHFHLDHLGTPRLITGNGGAEVSRHTYHPFGEEISRGPTEREKKQFTGHERDSESLDYMHARFYAPFMGRFLSVDPKLDLKRTLRNPQGWNRYAYVLNNPLRYVDPKGLIQYEAFLLGRSITVDISDDLTKRQQAALQRKIEASLKALNDKAEAGKLTRQDFRILSNIQEVRVVQSRVVDGQETRSSADEKTGVFTMTDKYVSGSSAKWTASAIGHDGFHVQQFNEGGYSASRGLQSERPAMEYQVGLGRRIGLDAWSLGYLQDLINDPSRLEQYRQQPAAADNED